MASYAADIRIGVTGKAQLNSLEKQLNRVNSQVNKLNKALTLRARVQAIRLDTRAATTAVKNLEDRINRLGRTITINLRTRDKDQGKSGGGGNVAVVNQAPTSTAQSVAKASIINDALRTQVALTNEAQKTLDVENKRKAAIEKLVDNQEKQEASQKKLNKLLEQQQKLQASTNNRVAGGIFQEKGITREEGLKRINRQINDAKRSLTNLQQIQVRFKNDVVDTSRAYRAVQSEIKKTQVATDKAARRQARFRKGRQAALRGATASAALIPGVSPFALGAAAGSKFGPKGAAIGVAVAGLTQLATAMTAFGKESAVAYAEFAKFRLALQSVAGSDFEGALASARQSVSDFNTPLTDAIQQITKLTAAGKANGLTMQEIDLIYQGLGAANKALGGDSEKLQGILLATTQVLSKGKVQAEELRGQIGERLPGAFALFAQAVGKTPAQLDKALEKGEVSIADFVKFAQTLLDKYEDDAKRIANSPSEAGARLQKALADLKIAIGPLFASLGASFQDFATSAINALTPLLEKLAYMVGLSNTAKKDRITQINDLLNQNTTRTQKLLPRLGETGVAERISTIQRQSAELEAERDRLEGEVNAVNKVENKTKPSPSTGTDKGKKPRDLTKQLQAQLAATDALLAGEKERAALSGLQQENALYVARQSKLAIQLERDKKLVATENITEASKQLKLKLLDKQYSLDLLQLENDRKQLNYDRTRAFEGEVAGLQTELDLSRALTDQDRARIENAAAIAAIKRRDDLTPERMQQLISLQRQFNAERLANAAPLNAYVKGLNSELQDTQQMLVEVAQTVQGSLTNAFSSVFTGLVEGTQSAQQVLLNFFKSIGDAFIQMATEIIAKQLVMITLQSILKALGGASGGTETNSQFMERTASLDTNIGNSYSSFLTPRAKGGPVNKNEPYLVGEKGPELFVPGTSGGVVPNDKMGGDVNSVINITISDDGTSTDAEQASELGRMVEASVMGVITRERRPGGILSR